MGNWHISIRGTGAHHNRGYAKDANRMAQEFVRELTAAGHQIEGATFHHGSADDLQRADYTPYEESTTTAPSEPTT